MSAASGRCFYQVLEVPPHAQKQEIKIAYRRLALRFHPDKNQGDLSAKVLFQEIQAAYETLSQDDKRTHYDTTARFVPSTPSRRAWREPSYEPWNAYTSDPPCWSVELREMTVQKCARIAKIQFLESQLRESMVKLNDMVDAENKAISKENQTRRRFSFIRLRHPKAKDQRHQDFLTNFACINKDLARMKHELRTAHEDHTKTLEKDNKRKLWWARERVRRVEEENRRAAATAAQAARRRAERAREGRDRDREAAREAEEIRREVQEEAARAARAEKAGEEARRRAERARNDPEAARMAEREAQEWLARQRRKAADWEW